MANLISEENLGAWLLKCDPTSKFDLPAAMADGVDTITEWSVVPGYRSEMMAPGDKVVFWVSGNGRIMTRGIWGIGHVTDYVQDSVPEDLQKGDINYWKDEEARLAVELSIPVDVPLFDEAVSVFDLQAAGIVTLEVQRLARGSNPSWVSKEQLAALVALLPAWPGEPENQEEIAISTSGAGFGTAAQNAVVEAAAMTAVIEFYRGWRSKDVSKDKVGWDISFTHRETRELARAEVNGVSGSRPIVLLTANELKAAKHHPEWTLAVVTRALSDPKVVEYSAAQALDSAKPYVFKADLSDL